MRRSTTPPPGSGPNRVRNTAHAAPIMPTRPPIGPTPRKANMPRPPSKSLMPHRPAIHSATTPLTNQPTTAPTMPASSAPT